MVRHLFLAVLFFLAVWKLIVFSVVLLLQSRETFAQKKIGNFFFISANSPFRMEGERDLFQIACFKTTPVNETGDLVIIHMEKAQELNNIFASVFDGSCSSHTSLVPKSQGKDWRNKVQHITGEHQIWDHSRNMNIHNSMRLNEMHPRVLKELADIVAKPLSIIPEKSWHSDIVPSDGKKRNITLILRKAKRPTLGNTDVLGLYGKALVAEGLQEWLLWEHARSFPHVQ